MAGSLDTPMLALVYQFLIDSNYAKSAAALVKESKSDLKTQSATQSIKLINVYQAYCDANLAVPSVIETPAVVEEKPTKSKSKRKAAEPVTESPAVESAVVEEPKKKKAKKVAESTIIESTTTESINQSSERASRSKTAAAETPKVEEKPVKKSKAKKAVEPVAEPVEQIVEPVAEPESKPEKKSKSKAKVVKSEPPVESTPEPVAEPVKEEKVKKTRAKKEKAVEEPIAAPVEDEKPSFTVPQVHSARLAQMVGVTQQKPVFDDSLSSGKQSKSNKPFQRINPNEINTLPEAMHDNSYTVDRAGSYGNAANNILITVKGKRFQHEKTKKKRGNYRGGELDQNVRSIKFD